MDDIADLSQVEDEIRREAIVKTAKNALIQDNLTDKCIDCEGIIPEERREAIPNCCRCIQCQTEFDVGNLRSGKWNEQYITEDEDEDEITIGDKDD